MKGSSYRGHYHGIHADDRIWDEPRYSADDDSSGFDKEEIDHAVALSLSERDQKGKKVIVCEDLDHAVALSLSEIDQKGKKVIVGEEIDHAIALSLSEIDQKGNKVIDEHDEDERRAIAQQERDERQTKAQQLEDEQRARAKLEEDEQLAKAIQESLKVDASPRYDSTNICQPFLVFFPSGYRICAGCNTKIGHGQYLSRMGAVWHPECFCCYACNLPITDVEFSLPRDRPYHKYCYKEKHHPKCYICHNFIPTNSAGLTEYRAHPFWLQKYCPSHESDGTPRCCSCERMELRDTSNYLSLDDGRKLCMECLDSAIMDTHECQPLYLEIQEFYEGLNMKVEQQVPLLLVERPALNKAMEGEKNGHHHLPETRGLCLSEQQTVTNVRRRPKIVAGYQLIDTTTEPYRLIRRCEVTAILVLYGLPRLLTGSILAHEMMHAWLRLKGYRNLRSIVEEGICQVLAHMWLESEIYAGLGSDVASSSSSSSASSKKGKHSDFEKDFGKFLKHLIESDTSSSYGEGFREGNKAVKKYGLRRTLDHILMTGSFPC